MDIPFLLNRWFHLAAVIVAVGGTVFIRLVFHPALKSGLPDEAATSVREAVLRRWGRFVHLCIVILIITGTYNTLVQVPRHPVVPGQMPIYHVLLGIKLILALGLFFIASVLVGRSQTFEGMRRKRPLWLGVGIGLAAVIVLLSNILKNLPPTA